MQPWKCDTAAQGVAADNDIRAGGVFCAVDIILAVHHDDLYCIGFEKVLDSGKERIKVNLRSFLRIESGIFFLKRILELVIQMLQTPCKLCGHGFGVLAMHGLSDTGVKQAVASFATGCQDLTRHCEMTLRLCDFFKVRDAVCCPVFREEEVTTQISTAWFKIMGEIGMPAGCHCLQEDCLGSSSNLQINAAGGTVFDGIQILIDGGLTSLIDKGIQRSSICLIINDKQGIALHKACRGNHIGPETKDSIILLQYDDGRLHQAVLNE